MKLIVHSTVGSGSIRDQLGAADYSYYFVLDAFKTALERFADVVMVRDPAMEVDPIYDRARESGEVCLFLSFAPPHKTVTGLRCPVVPVFAWEFGTMPNEVWDGEPRNDWRCVFAASAGAIALSSYTVTVVQDAMGPGFPIAAIPTPLFERFAMPGIPPCAEPASVLRVAGSVFDTGATNLYRHAAVWPPQPVPLLTPGPVAEQPTRVVAVAVDDVPDVEPPPRPGLRRRLQVTKHFALEWYRLVLRDLLPGPVRSLNAMAGRISYAVYREMPAGRRQAVIAIEPSPPVPEPAAPVPDTAPSPPVAIGRPAPEVELALDGVVYVSVFSPLDGRKNWFDLVTAFCWAFRDTEDAILVLKIVGHDRAYLATLRHLLGELSPFRCRVVAVQGYLEDGAYRALIEAADFYVNASHCEGLCMPMTEFMSAGTAAIAPDHTAFEDYITPANAFVVGSGPEHNVWPDDTRDLFRTTRYRIDWNGLMLAYRESYRVAKHEPDRHRAMGENAASSMQAFCAIDPVTERLRTFLQSLPGVDTAGMERAA